MKKIKIFMLPLLAITMLLAGCKKEDGLAPDDNGSVNSVGKFTQAELVSAIDVYYKAWEEEPVIPAEMKVGDKTLNFPQYVYAMAKVVVDIKDGKKDDVDVLNFKAPSDPTKDSYDKEEIAVFNEAKGEDLGTIATQLIADMDAKGQVPNRALITRGSEKLAFSTNRAAVTMARAISAYKEGGKMPEKVKTDYLSTSATLKGFASQVILYLRKWEETIGTVSADGSRSILRDPANPHENAHFIPIPWHPNCSVAADGEAQYNIQYQPYLEIDVAGQKYDAAQALGVSLAGLLDLVTVEGSSVKQTVISEPVHTPGNGANMGSPIPPIQAGYAWGPHPWYENESENGPFKYNGAPAETVGIDFIIKIAPWLISRSTGDLGRYPNYFTFGSGALELEGYTGYCCPMRAFVISLRFWDYIVTNNITTNVYDALKDVRVPADLYGSEQPPLAVDKAKVELPFAGGTDKVKVTSKDEAWTATVEQEVEFVTISPDSGNAGDTEVTITVAANDAAARSAKIRFTTASGSVKQVTVSQESAPAKGNLKGWAQEFVKCLDVWATTIGRVEADGTMKGSKAFENVHFIPIAEPKGNTLGNTDNQYDAKWSDKIWTMTYDGFEYTSNQAWEIAIRGLLNMVTSEGEAGLPAMDDRNKPWTFANNAAFATASVPAASSTNAWGAHPWYEVENPVKYNGETVKEVGLDFIVKACSWHVVRGLVKTAGNANPLGYIGNFQEFGTSSSQLKLDGYAGYISAMRELLIVARVYKYLLDNNVDANVYDAIKDVKFDYDLYGQDKEVPSLKGWAKEFVKCLDVWENTVGKVEADGTMKGAKAFTDAHFIPIPEPEGNANGNVGNQYDAMYADKIWTMTYGDITYTSAQAWEISIRGLLNMVTAEGEAGLPAMDDRNKPWTFANGVAMAEAPVPAASDNCIWGAYPWYEVENPVKYNGAEVKEVGLDFVVKACSWHVVRGLIKTAGNTSPLGKIGNFQEFGTSSSQLNLEGYAGYICPMRELLIVARIYKHLLDNNVDEKAYDAIKDKKFDYDLYYMN